ncbi:hypothetical protein, partial [Mesorhizobium japonicum]|uniref:hypothetical protein n=1 Tax=Mesorhizobium japonicum TaxID=2066070 RepID=UPI003B5AB016
QLEGGASNFVVQYRTRFGTLLAAILAQNHGSTGSKPIASADQTPKLIGTAAFLQSVLQSVATRLTARKPSALRRS